MRFLNLATLLLAAGALGAAGAAWCQDAEREAADSTALAASAAAQSADQGEAPPAGVAPAETTSAPPAEDSSATAQSAERCLASDIRRYFTAPLHWDRGEWAWFGGALLAIGAAHHYDTQVRTHFIKTLGASPTGGSKDVQDALPTAAVLAGTWAYATLIDDSTGRREAWTMLEAAGLSSVTAYALKYALGRDGPDQTSDPNQWRKSGGNSFPSWHATAAFAVGTVLAEAGNDEFRWVRRLLGYGLGAATSYERLKHRAHWLSDTVAGAALGVASAHFALSHAYRANEEAQLMIVPLERGAMLTYGVSLP